MPALEMLILHWRNALLFLLITEVQSVDQLYFGLIVLEKDFYFYFRKGSQKKTIEIQLLKALNQCPFMTAPCDPV